MVLIKSIFLTMKRSLSSSKGQAGNRRSEHKKDKEIEWELRPGGMLVQKRYVGDSSINGVMIKIRVCHGSYHHDVSVPAQSTFGDLKRALATETGLEPKEQRLLFKGKEKEDEEILDMVGVDSTSKIILLEDPASRERKLDEMKRNKAIFNAYEEVSKVRAEVDRLTQKVVDLETVVIPGGNNVTDKEFLVLTELLMTQLLKLDSIQADGEAKVQRRVEVRRVQSLVDAVDNLKVRRLNRFSSGNNTVSVTSKWEMFESGVGSLSAPRPIRNVESGIGGQAAPSRIQSSSIKITEDWERFD